MTNLDIDVAELFHENSKVTPYQNGENIADLPEPMEADVVLQRFRLPKVAPSKEFALEEAIEWRFTNRSFNPVVDLPLATLSRLLAFSCGLTTPFSAQGLPHLAFRRAAPTAGATYPIEVYPVVMRVAGLPAGVYHYATSDHSLEFLRAGRFGRHLAVWTLYQPYIADTSVLFVMAGFPDRIRPRYGERGYRYMLLEAGHIAQNLNLLGTAYGLGVLCNGGFVDAAISRLLGLDGVTQLPLYITAVGVRA